MISSNIHGQYHYPFGMVMPGREHTGPENYRYGFNGQEKDDEVKGDNNSLAFKYRIHDPRLGRFLSVDPVEKDYPWNSTFAFAENDVIRSKDVEGAEKLITIDNVNTGTQKTVVLEENGQLGDGILAVQQHVNGNITFVYTPPVEIHANGKTEGGYTHDISVDHIYDDNKVLGKLVNNQSPLSQEAKKALYQGNIHDITKDAAKIIGPIVLGIGGGVVMQGTARGASLLMKSILDVVEEGAIQYGINKGNWRQMDLADVAAAAIPVPYVDEAIQSTVDGTVENGVEVIGINSNKSVTSALVEFGSGTVTKMATNKVYGKAAVKSNDAFTKYSIKKAEFMRKAGVSAASSAARKVIDKNPESESNEKP